MKKDNYSKSRRSFLTFSKTNESKGNDPDKGSVSEKIKMLTRDGSLVEVDKSLLQGSRKKRRASQEDIHFWNRSNHPLQS